MTPATPNDGVPARAGRTCPEGFHDWPLERRNEFFAKYDAGVEGLHQNGRKTFTTTSIGKASYLRYCLGKDCGLAVTRSKDFDISLITFWDTHPDMSCAELSQEGFHLSCCCRCSSICDSPFR